jgi:hypothetical protein
MSSNEVKEFFRLIDPATRFPFVVFTVISVNEVTGELEETFYEHLVLPYKFEIRDQITGQLLGARYQLPIILAFACTIHKVQGCTLPAVNLVLDRVWSYGQVYTGCGRVRRFKDLKIILPPSYRWCLASPEVQDFLRAQESSMTVVDNSQVLASRPNFVDGLAPPPPRTWLPSSPRDPRGPPGTRAPVEVIDLTRQREELLTRTPASLRNQGAKRTIDDFFSPAVGRASTRNARPRHELPPLTELFFCPMCQEEHPLSLMFVMPRCGHICACVETVGSLDAYSDGKCPICRQVDESEPITMRDAIEKGVKVVL